MAGNPVNKLLPPVIVYASTTVSPGAMFALGPWFERHETLERLTIRMNHNGKALFMIFSFETGLLKRKMRGYSL
jgi:hypothetical protein